jgi:acetyltransferase-like isoleucine patch superfamily enzyme
MSYYTEKEIDEQIPFKRMGKNILVSKKASIYNASEIQIGDNVRIDDFCILSGKINIGSYVHVTPMCLIAGGIPGICLDDYVTLAYGVKMFSQSDDYSGKSMCNSLIDREFKKEIFNSVHLEKHVIVGTNSVVMPGVTLKEGTAIGAMSLVLNDTLPWSIYVGIPAKKIKNRNKELLILQEKFEIGD